MPRAFRSSGFRVRVFTRALYSSLSLPTLICCPCLLVRPTFMMKRIPTPNQSSGPMARMCDIQVIIGTAILPYKEATTHLPRLGPLPVRVMVEGENLLDGLGPATAGLVVQHLQRLADLAQTRILIHCGFIGTPVDAVQDSGKVEELAAGFQEIGVQGGAGGQGRQSGARAGSVVGVHGFGGAKRRW